MNNILLAVFTLFSTCLYSQSWVSQASAPIGRHHPISFSLNGKGYAVTGSLSSGQPTDEVYQYDPVADSWTKLNDFPGSARSFGIGAVADNGKAYIGFGATNTQYLRDFWSLDSNGTWTQLASCDCSGRRHPALIAIGDRIYVGLGDDSGGDRNDWWMYSIADDSWTQIANLPGLPRHHPYMFKAGGHVFAGLGHSGGTIYRDWFKLDTATNTWTPMNVFPGEGRVAGTQFSMNGFGYILSGDGDDHGYMPTGEMWRYDPANDTWTQLPSHPGESRWAPGSFIIDKDVYFFGGLNRFTSLFPTDLWKFDMAAASVGLDEEVADNNYLFPNPANEFLRWKSDESVTHVKVYNALGLLVLTSSAEANELNTQNLSNGLYSVQFSAYNKVIKTSKLLINH